MSDVFGKNAVDKDFAVERQRTSVNRSYEKMSPQSIDQLLKLNDKARGGRRRYELTMGRKSTTTTMRETDVVNSVAMGKFI